MTDLYDGTHPHIFNRELAERIAAIEPAKNLSKMNHEELTSLATQAMEERGSKVLIAKQPSRALIHRRRAYVGLGALVGSTLLVAAVLLGIEAGSSTAPNVAAPILKIEKSPPLEGTTSRPRSV